MEGRHARRVQDLRSSSMSSLDRGVGMADEHRRAPGFAVAGRSSNWKAFSPIYSKVVARRQADGLAAGYVPADAQAPAARGRVACSRPWTAPVLRRRRPRPAGVWPESTTLNALPARWPAPGVRAICSLDTDHARLSVLGARISRDGRRRRRYVAALGRIHRGVQGGVVSARCSIGEDVRIAFQAFNGSAAGSFVPAHGGAALSSRNSGRESQQSGNHLQLGGDGEESIRGLR